MSITSTEVNAMVYKYLVEAGQYTAIDSCCQRCRLLTCSYAGFVHSSFAFAHESQVTRGFSDLSSVPPCTLIRLLQKGIQFAEMEANLKEVQLKTQRLLGVSQAPSRHSKRYLCQLQDRTGIEDDYQVLDVADIMMNKDLGDLRDVAQNQRAEREEESDGMEDEREALQRAPAVRQAQLAPRLLPPEQKPPKASKRSKGRPALAHQQQQSPSAERELNHATQPALAAPGTDRLMLDQAQAAAQPSQAMDHASVASDLPNGHSQPAAKPASERVPFFSSQATVLDSQSRETNMCSWWPTAAVLASG